MAGTFVINDEMRHRAHDLRNLFGVIESARRLLEDGPDEARRKRILDAIGEAVARGGILTTRLLEHGSGDRCKPIDLRKRLRQLEPLLRTILGNHQMLLDAGDLPAVARVVPEQFDNVIIELVANARRALRNRGAICVRLRRHSSKIRLLVADNGTGMTRSHSRTILLRAPTAGGHGTGWQEIRDFVGRAHGRLAIRSSPGRGTIVAIELPQTLGLKIGGASTSEGREDTAVPRRPRAKNQHAASGESI